MLGNSIPVGINSNRPNNQSHSIGSTCREIVLNRQAAAEAEKTQLALQQEVLRLRDYERQLKLSIREVVRSTYSNIEEIEALKISIEAAREKVEFATMMFNLGRASNLDVTDAQEALLKAQTQYLKKLIDYHLQLAFLETLIAQPIVF
ncbi:MAG: TolC family protein [candidate division KSB1 bacterium]|nr:TolC family protein [candidate division KSB1 bacterium]